MKRIKLLKTLLLLCVFIAGAHCVKAQDTIYTKWKKTALNKLQTGDRVVIADLNKAVAISNENGDKKAPKAISVSFNSEKTRITDEAISDSAQWIVTVTDGNITFSLPNDAASFLYADADKGLRVGAEVFG